MDSKTDVAHVDVRYVADLARIALTDDEVMHFEQQLDDVLQYIGQLKELDVSGIEPMAHAMARSNVMRDDVQGDTLDREKVLDNAPATAQDAYIRVPVVIEEED